MNAPARIVKLQVNTTGAWRNIMDFDCQDEDQVLRAAADLFRCCKGATLRCIMPGETAPLMYWSHETDWEAYKGHA